MENEHEEAICGGCDLHWCFGCDPGPSALCPRCNGRGYTIAPTCKLEEVELPCEREPFEPMFRDKPVGFWCINDHTGCIWNDGNNTCMAPEEAGTSPLGELE